jgi:formylglycine-generating enzyme required for sulfatase activity
MNAVAVVLLLLAGAQVYAQTEAAPSVPVQAPALAAWTNSLGMVFVFVPGAKLRIAIWETRVKDYEAFHTETSRPWTKPDFAQTPEHPVVNVTWEDAQAFCQWLTAKERDAGQIEPRQRYRLPSDAEWDLAVGLGLEQGRTPEDRMKSLVVWPWGSSWPPQPGDGNYGPDLAMDDFPATAPVGRFRPNRYGLFDLGGNVWEWCEDWFNAANVTKVLRGASFGDGQPKDLLASYRFSATVHLGNDDIGFRVVFETPER